MPDSPDFRSPYRHGFVRVAAATLRTVIGDPAANAGVRARHGTRMRRRGRRARRLPGADAHRLLDRGHPAAGHPARRGRGGARRDRRGLRRPAAGARRRPAGARPQPDLQRRRRRAPRPAARRRAQVVPAELPRVLRAPPDRAGRRPARHDPPRRRGGAVRAGPALRRRGRARFVLHVEICEDMWVPVPPSATAALAGATVLANLSGSPITIGRAETRCLLARSASARCLAAYVYSAAGEGESSTDLAWDGQTMIWENGKLLAETERFPKGPRHSVADVDLDLLRAERLRMGTFDDNRRAFAERTDGSGRRVPARPAGRRPRAAPRARAVPVRAGRRARLEQDCYEGYSIQVSGLEQRMRAIGQPKLVIGVSGGLDSTRGDDRACVESSPPEIADDQLRDVHGPHPLFEVRRPECCSPRSSPVQTLRRTARTGAARGAAQSDVAVRRVGRNRWSERLAEFADGTPVVVERAHPNRSARSSSRSSRRR